MFVNGIFAGAVKKLRGALTARLRTLIVCFEKEIVCAITGHAETNTSANYSLCSLFCFVFFLLVVVAIFLDKTCKLYRYRVLIASARLVWLDSFKLAALFPLPFPPFTKRADVEMQTVSLFSEEMTSTRLTTDHISNRSILFWTWLKFLAIQSRSTVWMGLGGWAVAHCRIPFVGGLILSMDE